MESQSLLVAEAERFCTRLITTRVASTRLFHGIEHTRSVATNCLQLAQLESCSVVEIEILLVSAWFDDTGYIVCSRGHEQESAKNATAFLRSTSRDGEFTQRVHDVILATKIPPSPSGLLQKIICDADMSHLGSVDYERWQALLRRELELSEKVTTSDKDWLRENISFFQHHRYYTIHARELWEEQKQLNLERLLDIAASVY